MDKLSDEEKEIPASEKQLNPQDFEKYLPWACQQFRIDANLVITTKIHYVEKPNLGSGKSRKSTTIRLKREPVAADSDKSSIQSIGDRKNLNQSDNTVQICAVYDIFGNLIQLKFFNNKKIPMQLLRLIGLIIHFHNFMTTISINSGLNNGCLHELNKLLVLANITDICLDNSALDHGNYDSLLENKNKLRHLSMARCNINDDIVKKIAIHLRHPLPASRTLLLLNLSSNSITDLGANHLAAALRTNRQLVYLNLAGNRITDDGAKEMFDMLTDFLVTNEEMVSFRYKYVQYIKQRNCLIKEIAHELKCADFDRKSSKKKPVSYKKGLEKDNIKVDKSIAELDTMWLEKAKIIAVDRMGQLEEPFSTECVYFKDDQIYCYGNNRLAYINISYNSLGYPSVKKILSVLLNQQSQNRTPKGLVNVSLEGNLIPAMCRELKQIDEILLASVTTKTVPKLRK